MQAIHQLDSVELLSTVFSDELSDEETKLCHGKKNDQMVSKNVPIKVCKPQILSMTSKFLMKSLN